MTITDRLLRAARRPPLLALALLVETTAAYAQLPVASLDHSDCIIEPMVVVEVGTAVSGVIDEMLVKRADRVASGQPLARIESSVEQVTLRRSQERADMRSELRARAADLELAKHKMQRIRDLFARSMVSKQQRDEAINELERAEQAVKIAREKLRLAQLDLEHAQAQLERRTIRSPIQGVVIERLAQAGEYVDERPLLTVAQLNPLRVEVLMPAQAFGTVAPGMPAKVMPELAADEPLDAKVVLVDPIIDTASGTFGVRLELPNADYRIPSGMRCRVSFLDAESDLEGLAGDVGEGLDDAGFLAPRRAPRTVLASTEAGPRDPGGERFAPAQAVEVGQPVAETADFRGPDPPAAAAIAVASETPPEPVFETDAADALEPLPEIPDDVADAEPPVDAVIAEPASGPDVAAAEVEASAAAVYRAPTGELAGSCWRLGPWRERAARDAVAKRLGRVGAHCEVGEDSEAAARRWLVYVPGLEGRDTADQLARLAMAGYEDLYVIRRGRQRGDISVGLYTQERNAERRHQELQAHGFDARIAPRKRPVQRFWLQVTAVDEHQLESIDGLADIPRVPTACAHLDSGLMLGDPPAGQVVSRAD